MKVYFDNRIFQLQPTTGGISYLWSRLQQSMILQGVEVAELHEADVFISTYYAPKPRPDMKSIVLVMDYIAERYPYIGRYHPDAVAKRVAVDQADAVVSISNWTAGDVQRFNNRYSDVAMCGGGSDYKRKDDVQVNEFQRSIGVIQPYLLLVGKRRLYKNVGTFYQTWRMMGMADHIILAVGGEDPSSYEESLIERGQMRHVRLSADALACAYSGATALIYPSLYEGFGLPVVEAMSCGCPVVSGVGGALLEVAGGNNFNCDPLLPMSIAHAITETLDPALRTERVLAGYVQAKKFTWERMAEKMVSTIDSLG